MNHSFTYYSLAVEERRVSNNLENLSKLVDEYGLPNKPKHMLEEISFLERELRFLKEEIRNRKYSQKDGSNKMALASG